MFIIMMIISMLIGNDSYYNYNFQSYIYIMIIIAISIYYIFDTNYNRKKLLLIVLLIDSFYVGINTFLQLQITPDISRILATSSEHAELIMGEISVKGIGSFGYFYSLVIIGILLAYKLLIAKNKFVYFSLLCGILILFLNAQFTMALIFFILFVFIVLIFENKKDKKNIIFKFIIVLVFLIFILNISKIIESISLYIGDDLSQRLKELNDFIMGNELTDGDIVSRKEIYQISIDSFKNNILYGSFGKHTFGGHSSILDILAAFGLIGILVFNTFYKMYKYIKNNVDINQNNIVNITFLYYLALSFFNPSHISTIVISLFITLPLFLTVFYRNKGGIFKIKIFK
ncbi:MAG: O-antigen ligase family protein [[Clostridium] spiroforme]|uniref:O-antigen ligase family protein n=1 Tax=Thomasclavelia spiroformis TaxID=29348 RepID=A0A943I852_9FIRM|nr:O-antigen polymerase [Thomasclavelia spiroformis]MBS5588776.1 O-antigen ligase family protein [Thomasclavelia spiroformis]